MASILYSLVFTEDFAEELSETKELVKVDIVIRPFTNQLNHTQTE
ncbi:MAG: hypothetical protein WBB27_17955 [Maribacter sp.]